MIPEMVVPIVLILQIGSDDYRLRQSAAARLGNTSTDVIVWRFGRLQARRDPEVKHRLQGWLASLNEEYANQLYFIGNWTWIPSWKKSQFLILYSNNTYSLSCDRELSSKGSWRIKHRGGKDYLTLYDTNTLVASWWRITSKDKESFRLTVEGIYGYDVEVKLVSRFSRK